MGRSEADFAAGVGGWVKRHREARGLSQAELAERADVSTHFLGMIERGAKLPAVPTLFRLAQALGASIDEVIRPVADASRAWRAEAAALVAALPDDARPYAMAVLRALAEVEPSAKRPPRRRASRP